MSSPAADRRHKPLEERVDHLERDLHQIERLIPLMATQAEVDQLTQELTEVSTSLTNVSGDITAVANAVTTSQSTLQTEIDNLAKANPSIDLTALNAAAEPLAASATALDTAAKALEPAVEKLGDIKPVQAEPEGGGNPPAPAEGPKNTVYVFSSTNFEEPDQRFTASGFETDPTDGSEPVPVFYFSGDTAVGEQNGAGIAGYTVYEGPTQPVPPSA